METPSSDPTKSEIKNIPGMAWWYVALAIIIIGGVYIYLVTRNTPSTSSSNTADDPVTRQLQSVSDKTDGTTLKSEVEGTDLSDVATELDTVTLEAQGL